MKNLFYLTSMILLLFASCKDAEMEVINQTPILNPPMEELTGSVTGTVLDEEGLALADVEITYRGTTTTTDRYGYFTIANTTMYGDGTFLTANKSGYFQGSRKFYAVEDGHANISIQLIKKTLSQTISATSGGVVQVDDATVDLPAGNYRTADGLSYTGDVKVYAEWLDPTAEETFDEMPGDLTGVTTEGDIQGLQTYGMVVVELEDSNGAPLQMPDGENATLNMPVPSDLMGTAPSEIPLWYFDEENGTWVEEGSAQLVNGEYIGEVSHFTFWNCDVPYDFVMLEGAIHVNNVPVQNYLVHITNTEEGTYGATRTGAYGLFKMLVPKDRELTLRMASDCGNVGDVENIGSFSADENIGVINADVLLGGFSVGGTITDCNGDIADNAFVRLEFPGSLASKVILVNDDGSFFTEVEDCEVTEASLIAYNPISREISEVVDVPTIGFIDVGNLSTCEASDAFNDFILIYNNQTFGDYTTNLDTFGMVGTYEALDIDLGNGLEKHIYTVSLLDWFLAEQASGDFTFTDGDTEATFDFEIPSQGFRFSGVCDLQPLPELRFSGVSTEITVTDSSLFPGDIDQVFFDFRFY